MTWFWLALVAAAGYGVSYAVAEKLQMYISAASILLFSYVGSLLIYLFLLFREDVRQELTAVTEPAPFGWLLFYIVATITANVAVLAAIRAHSGTAAAIVETSVPLFAALAAFIIFREVQLTPSLIAGGSLIISGLLVIYFWQ